MVEDVVEAEHALEMVVRGELGGEGSADGLGRRVRRDQRRVRVLDALELGEQLVELPVGHDRRVQHVVPELVVADLFGQRGVPVAHLGRDVGDVLDGFGHGRDRFLGKVGAAHSRSP